METGLNCYFIVARRPAAGVFFWEDLFPASRAVIGAFGFPAMKASASEDDSLARTRSSLCLVGGTLDVLNDFVFIALRMSINESIRVLRSKSNSEPAIPKVKLKRLQVLRSLESHRRFAKLQRVILLETGSSILSASSRLQKDPGRVAINNEARTAPASAMKRTRPQERRGGVRPFPRRCSRR